jgi:acyl dehydratase
LTGGDRRIDAHQTPDRYLPHRYAGAAEDFNPIHLDAAAAQAVGLPRNILHGLYTMGLLARVCLDEFGGDPRTLRRLVVQFRGVGLAEEEIRIVGTVSPVRAADATVRVALEADQGPRPLIRNGLAEMVPPEQP